MAEKYADLGCDLMAAAAQKWQCARGGTGILIMRNKARANGTSSLPPYFPVLTSSGSLIAANQGVLPATNVKWTDRGAYNIANFVQSIGSMNVPAFNAVANACAEWDSIGRKKIETFVLAL